MGKQQHRKFRFHKMRTISVWLKNRLYLIHIYIGSIKNQHLQLVAHAFRPIPWESRSRQISMNLSPDQARKKKKSGFCLWSSLYPKGFCKQKYELWKFPSICLIDLDFKREHGPDTVQYSLTKEMWENGKTLSSFNRATVIILADWLLSR